MTHQVLVKKFNTAMNILKSDAEYVVTDKAPETELEFNSNVEWVTGSDSNGNAILTKTNPHAEITWPLVKAEMDKL